MGTDQMIRPRCFFVQTYVILIVKPVLSETAGKKRNDVDISTSCDIIEKLMTQHLCAGGIFMLDRFAKFSLLISEIDRCWHKLATEEMAKYELNSPHAVYLNTLYGAGADGVTAAQLGELCCKNKADVSRMVAILEKKGLVTKETAGGNVYRAKLLLTEEGKRAAEHVQQRAAVAVELAGSGMTDEEREVFYRCLERITTNLQTLSKEGLPL